uniref:Uncharacterized protein n=1 Tax=Monodelphis domestica TaxID=13616 RepID=A0A5F8GGG7_MONDO
MAFEDLLSEVGDKGRLYILPIFSFTLFLLFLSSQLQPENFTAFVPKHRCWVHELDNTSASLSVSEDLNLTSLLKVSIPLDSNGKPESCRQFFSPQWQALLPNVMPCVDGWVYDQSSITSSIVLHRNKTVWPDYQPQQNRGAVPTCNREANEPAVHYNRQHAAF